MANKGHKPNIETVKLAIQFGVNADPEGFSISAGVDSPILNGIVHNKKTPSVNQAKNIIRAAQNNGWVAPTA